MSTLEARFWAKLGERLGDGCREWAAGVNDAGYGVVHPDGAYGNPIRVHRLMWELTYGPIPPETPHVLHHCDNRRCCYLTDLPEAERVADHPSGLWTNRDGRAGHLWLGTNADNVADMVAKGRSEKVGEANSQAKVTAAIVLDIRARVATGERQADLATEYGLSRASICQIVKRVSWTHL